MKYIVKQKVLWLVILMLLLSINTLEEKSCLTHNCAGQLFSE